MMRIGDDNLFEIGCRKGSIAVYDDAMTLSHLGVECPAIGDHNTICTKARIHHTVRLSNHCVVSAKCLVAPAEDETLDEFTVIYGPDAERRSWSGRGKVQEADLRRKHAEYLREMLPKFNRLRRGEASQ